MDTVDLQHFQSDELVDALNLNVLQVDTMQTHTAAQMEHIFEI